MDVTALATDYDETLAEEGLVSATTLSALRKLKDSGRRLILVSGRQLPDLRRVFPNFSIFDRIVAENGAILHDPATGNERLLAPAPPPAFVESLRTRGVDPLLVGQSVIGTLVPNEMIVLDEIRRHGLELEIIFNKGAVMVLPSGINKATGLMAALDDLDMPIDGVVAIGDAENDHDLLRRAGFGVAVANALPSLKNTADRITLAPAGDGVTEIIDAILRGDIAVGGKIDGSGVTA
ncbi:MAG: HAD family phosphatase [Aquamicrobium sp.]|uniref:HAD family hydrolase n=1 Tax=Mesorhizobium sp. Pch-S TaxID=2082387 RepID=UPI0010108A23|nr:HAD family hydrolase [Mesorhizobium sp. Pch-S]MBR2686860.1 HAD family phosphatase [Aquamicrobium sp.]QAZ46644.1 haloacid dehalogenase [Mesorhizobium sp. Pch-S]